MPQMKDMAQWIQARAKTQGGVFTRPAAVELAELVGTEPRLADQEIIKLLTYVNYRRPVEREDVHHLTADTREGDIFILVDALGNRNTKAAMAMLQRLLDQDEPLNIFAMIVRQFRLLMQAREILDRNGVAVDVARELRLHPYVADKIGAQSRRFSTSVLELIYHRMLEIDRMIKSSQMPADLELETFVAALGGIHPIDADPEMVW
jgi:DNA polymerase-3 subunit delta